MTGWNRISKCQWPVRALGVVVISVGNSKITYLAGLTKHILAPFLVDSVLHKSLVLL